MKLRKLLVGAAGAAVLASPFSVVMAGGPARQTYTCNSAGQCIGADHVQFDSFTNNPSYGDERDFVTVRDSAAGTNTYSNSIAVTPGHSYVIRFYVHNNAQQDLAGTPSNYIASNTAVRVALPSQVNGSADVTGYISASNANPGTVYDEATFTSNGAVNLSYVAGSARILTNGINTTLSDSIVGGGAPVGYSALDGNWPGCFNYSGWVTLTVQASSVPTPTPAPTPTPTPVKPATSAPKPAALPNTGAGDVLGVFTGASAAGTAAHYAISRRRK